MGSGMCAEHLICTAGGRNIAFPTNTIDEIVPAGNLRLRAIPGSPRGVRGLIGLGDSAVVVLDPFPQGPEPKDEPGPGDCIVVFRGEHRLGFLADSVSSIKRDAAGADGEVRILDPADILARISHGEAP